MTHPADDFIAAVIRQAEREHMPPGLISHLNAYPQQFDFEFDDESRDHDDLDHYPLFD